MNKEPLTVLIDNREKIPLKFTRDVDTHSCTLETGDYSIAPNSLIKDKYTDKELDYLFCIEKKGCVSEIAMNVTQPRFKAELNRLALYKYKFLLLEFSASDVLRYPYGSNIPKRRWKYLKVKPAFIISCLNAISINYGIHIIYAGSPDNAAYLAADLIKRVYKQIGEDKNE